MNKEIGWVIMNGFEGYSELCFLKWFVIEKYKLFRKCVEILVII